MLSFSRVFSQIGKGKGNNGSMPKLYIRYGTDTGTLRCRGGVLALLFLSLSTLICGYLFFTAGQVAVAAAFWLFSSLLVLLVLAAVVKKVTSKTSIAQAVGKVFQYIGIWKISNKIIIFTIASGLIVQYTR